MVTLFLRQGETGKQVLLSFPVTTPAEKEDVTATMEKLRSISRTVTIQGAASEVMNLGQHLRGIDLAAEGELERINQLAERLEHMSEVDCDKFAGMLDANKISGTKDILQLTEHLDDYVILPGCSSAQSIGKYLMDCGVAPTLKQLCKNIDYEAVGQIFLDAHSGAACSRGFVVRNEHLPRAVLKGLHIEPQQEAHMNTQIRYLYRDASNYKVENECVVTGTFTPEQIAQIMDCCDLGEYFIPTQVGLSEQRFDRYDPEEDHCWFELSEDGFEETAKPATVGISAQQLVENFAAAKEHWNDTAFQTQMNEMTLRRNSCGQQHTTNWTITSMS